MTIFQMAEELADEQNRIKMCYALARSPEFYYQELAVFNPEPSSFLPGFVVPRDLFAYIYDSSRTEPLKSIEDLQRLIDTRGAAATCIASHDPCIDRTIQLISLPQRSLTPDLEPTDLMIINFLVPLSSVEKQQIIDDLKAAYYAL